MLVIRFRCARTGTPPVFNETQSEVLSGDTCGEHVGGVTRRPEGPSRRGEQTEGPAGRSPPSSGGALSLSPEAGVVSVMLFVSEDTGPRPCAREEYTGVAVLANKREINTSWRRAVIAEQMGSPGFKSNRPIGVPVVAQQ